MAGIQKPTAEGIEVASRNFAEAMMADQLNTAIAALVAAIENQSDATNDVSSTAGISYSAMNDAHAKFGDHSGNLIAQVMNGTAYHKLIGNNLTNTQQLFQAQNVRVVDILGKAVVVTDAPALYEAGVDPAPDLLKVLSLSLGRNYNQPALGFVDLTAQRWPQIVKEVTLEAKARIG